MLTVKPSRIWRPDLTAYNAADGDHQLGNVENHVHAKIWSSGLVRWSPIKLYTVSCPMKFVNYPFDMQVCMIKLGSWAQNTKRLNFSLIKSQIVDKEASIPLINMWHIEDSISFVDAVTFDNITYQDVKFFILLRRNFNSVLVNVIGTCSILCFLCFFSFWVPTSAGERLSLSLSIIVAITVYQLITASLIPDGTDKIPIISIFLAVLVILVDFSVLITMVNLKIAYSIQLNPPYEWLFNLLVVYWGELPFVDIKSHYAYKNYLKFLESGTSEEEKRQLLSAKIDRVTTSKLIGSSTDTSTSRSDGNLNVTNDERTDQTHAPNLTKIRTEKGGAYRSGNNEYSLSENEMLADIKWDLISVAVDSLSMCCYAVIFFSILIWLFYWLVFQDDQMVGLYEQIYGTDNIRDHYDCEIKRVIQ